MKLNIRTRGLRIEHGTRSAIALRVGTALDRLGTHVRRVAVYLSDENGPRGGVDKLCRLVVHLQGGAAVIVEEQDASLREAIDRATGRAAEAVSRALDRVKTGRVRNADGARGRAFAV